EARGPRGEGPALGMRGAHRDPDSACVGRARVAGGTVLPPPWRRGGGARDGLFCVPVLARAASQPAGAARRQAGEPRRALRRGRRVDVRGGVLPSRLLPLLLTVLVHSALPATLLLLL
ncbi:MAG: hypothetical protein AVDCRST_MAG05-1324, partial [uncultured Rubrobacteraceae bacterium]